MRTSGYLRFGSILGIAGAVTALDQLSKWWIQDHMLMGESWRITSFFSLTLVYNTGSAFGLFQGNNRALLILAFIILGVLLYSARGLAERGGVWAASGVGLVIGGAVGNIIDRIAVGRVVDFLDFHFWPVFNAADSAITVGVATLMIGLWKKL